MKKILSLILTAALVLGVCTIVSSTKVKAAEVDYSVFNFKWDSENEVYYISGNREDPPSGTIIIPSEYNGKSVKVGYQAFMNCEELGKVVIENGITEIGVEAFWGCENLYSITIPASVKVIGNDAFYGVSWLDCVAYVEKDSYSHRYAVENDWNYEVIGGSENDDEFVGDDEFVDDDEFAECTHTCEWREWSKVSCTTDGVKIYECTKCFEEFDRETTENATGHNFVNDKCEYCEKALWEYKINGNEVKIIGYNGENTDVTIPESINGLLVTGILSSGSDNYNFTSYTTVVIPNTVVEIGERAFFVSPLKSVSIPDSVKTIGKEAFVDNGTYTSVYIPASVENIGYHAIGYSFAGFIGFADGFDVKKKENFTIYGEKGTVAEKYAKENDFVFVEKTNDAHKCSGGVATCTQKAVCTNCGVAYGDINPENHLVGNAGKEAIHSHCLRCGVTISEKHVFVESITKEATATEKGIKEYSCDCGYKYTKEIEKTGSGVVKIEPDEVNDFSATIEETSDIKTKINITKEEQAMLDSGLDLKVVLKVEKAEEKIDRAEEEAILKNLDGNVLGVILDIQLTKQIDSYESNIETTNGEIKISLELPETLINTAKNVERTYKVIRYHEGDSNKVTILDAKFNEKTNTLTFFTDRFSTYAVVYIDSSIAEGEKDVIPDAGVMSTTIIMFSGMVASGISIAVVSRKRKDD